MTDLRAENAALREQIAALEARLASSHTSTSSTPPPTTHPNPQAWSSGAPSLTAAHVARYSRHMLLPQFGPAAQARLAASSMLIVGTGGLGSPCALYLASAGVGRLGLCDYDVVELSNLHRQVMHTDDSIGCRKVDSAALACRARNRDASLLDIVTHPDGLLPHNAIDIVSRYDIILDCSDNAATRYLLNDACVVLHKPLVSGAAVGTDGQLTIYHGQLGDRDNDEYGPCYRCIVPECPSSQACQRCGEVGVLGPVPGVIGTLQALEAIKLATRVGQPLIGQLLTYDALSTRFLKAKLRPRSVACEVCGEQRGEDGRAKWDADKVAHFDYAAFTGAAPPRHINKSTTMSTFHEDGSVARLTLLAPEDRVTASTLARTLQESQGTTLTRPQLVDVRPAVQFGVVHLPHWTNVPYDVMERAFQQCPEHQLPECLETLNPEAPTVVLCRRGNDSQRAVQLLRDKGGFTRVRDVVGGLEAWRKEVNPDLPTY